MTKHSQRLLFLLLLNIIYSNYSNATVFTAQANGDWNTASTWDQGSVPDSLDEVVIDGLLEGTWKVIHSLPVELLKFNVIKRVDEVHLQWQTASETNASYFFVQRSDDGHFFEDLTAVLSRGESESKQPYTSVDVEPYYGLNYYRLKIVNLDGSMEYSNIESVAFELVPALTLFPNPLTNALNLEVAESTNLESILEVFDRNGRRIYIGKVNFIQGLLQLTTEEINVHSPGTYFLRVVGTKDNKGIRFIKLE